MGAGTHRDAGAVDDGRDIVRMGALDLEGDDRPLVLGRAENAQRVDLAQALMGILDQRGLVRPDARLADRVDIVDGGAEPDRLHDRRRAGLEPVRRLAIGDAVLEHLADHLAAAVERRHGAEMLMLAVEHADAGRPVELVAGEGVEVAADVLHVDVEVDGGLRAVHQHRNAARMRAPHDLLHRHQGAEHVRHMGDRHHLGARRQQLLEFVDEEIALVVDRRPFDHRALALAQEMPRHDVGMVLHDREHDLVAGLDALAAERIGDQVDRLGGVAGEDDLFLPRRH